MLKDLIKLADGLDRTGFIREATIIDDIIKKMAEDKDIAVNNDLSIPVNVGVSSQPSLVRTMKPGNMIVVEPKDKLIVKWKNSSNQEETLVFDGAKIYAAPRVGPTQDFVNLSALSNKFSSVGLSPIIDQRLWDKTLKDKSGYTYYIGRDGRFLQFTRGKKWKALNQSYSNWSQVVEAINKMSPE